MTDLRGRVAIVTGAGKGLGRAYALHLAACGAAVVVNNRRHAGEDDAQTSAAQVAKRIQQAGGQACAEWSDVAQADSGRALVDCALQSFGRLDIVVANAGVAEPTSFLKMDLAAYRAEFDVGFFGNLYLAHAAWPHLMAQKYGRVVLTTSSAGLYGDHGLAAYAASKAAVIGLAHSLAAEGARRNVRVNVVAPYGLSQMTEAHMPADLARRFDPARVAPLVAWLASEACTLQGEVLVSGAGLVRRALCGEAPGALFDPSDPGGALQALPGSPVRKHDSATSSFAHFVQELQRMEPALQAG